MTNWDDLSRELDLWQESGSAATFWWRDDDAHRPDPKLDRLLDISDRYEIALGLAVVPARIEKGLAERVKSAGLTTVLQHGYAHDNTAPPGGKKTELGPHRPAELTIADLATGQDRLTKIFGDQYFPVLVPPWNRIADFLVPMLPEIGFCGLSRADPRMRAAPAAGLIEANTHVDIIDWQAGGGRPETAPPLTYPRPFAGTAFALAKTVKHLAAKREGKVDADEPTGLLTHHLVHDDDAWAFVEAFLDRIRNHPAARWRSPADLFGR